MAESIKWDGSNINQVVMFVEKHFELGAITFHHERGAELHIYGTKLPVALGDELVAIKDGVTVKPQVKA